MSGVTPDDPNRRERERVVVLDIETVVDPDAQEWFCQEPPPFDYARYLGKLKRPSLDVLAIERGFDPKAFKTMGDLAMELTRIGPTLGQAEAHVGAWVGAWRSKAALRPMTGKVAAVGVVTYYGDAEDPDDTKTFAQASDVEMDLLLSVAAVVKGVDVLTGFNIVGFDGPYLKKRMMINGMDVPTKLMKFPRYRDRPIVDTMFELGDWASNPPGTLRDWCWRFGIKLPPDTDPKQIQEWYDTEQWHDLENHVFQDAVAAGELYKVIQPVTGIRL